MARLPKPTDFFIDVKDIGRFRIAKRTMELEMEIQRTYAGYAGGVEPTLWLATVSEYLSAIRVLVVEAPEDWDIDNMDPLDEETYGKLSRVYESLREREETFRKPAAGKQQEGGEGGDAERNRAGESVVQTDVPPATEQPPVS